MSPERPSFLLTYTVMNYRARQRNNAEVKFKIQLPYNSVRDSLILILSNNHTYYMCTYILYVYIYTICMCTYILYVYIYTICVHIYYMHVYIYTICVHIYYMCTYILYAIAVPSVPVLHTWEPETCNAHTTGHRILSEHLELGR